MTTDRSGTLRRRTYGGVAPGGVLEKLGELGLSSAVAFGIVMTPRRVAVARIGGGRLRCHGDSGPSLDEAYEIRLFGDGADAHWQRTGASDGRLVVLSEDTGPATADDIAFVATLPRRYLLWGRGSTATGEEDWSSIASRRIPPIFVPLPETRGPLALHATEYVGRLAHGNAAVVAERLTGFAPVVSMGADEVTEGGS